MIARSMWHYVNLRKNLHANPLDLRKKQEKMLRSIVKYAYANVPFYHEKFRANAIKPSDIVTIEDLKKIPITTKVEIQSTRFADLIARSGEGQHFIERETSGSTGIPLRLAIDPAARDFENAVWIRALFEDGMKPWHRMARIADPRNFPFGIRVHERLGLMRTKFISVFDSPSQQYSVVKEYRPDVIRGYTSCVENLANYCEENSKKIAPSIVFTSAELLDQKARGAINSAFHTELFDLYVCVELGLIAWECKEHSGYHINADSVIVEFAKNGDLSGQGEKGEVVCTGLTNRAMPLIRYRLGDVGMESDEQCPCGITLPLMKIVEGRTGDYLHAMDGRRIPPIVFFPFPFDELDGIKQFRVIQEEENKLLVELVTNSDPVRLYEILKQADLNLKSLFGNDMRVDFSLVKQINRDPTGKLKKIISHVNSNSI